MAGSVLLPTREVSADPGGEAICSVQIRNTGTVVDEFSVTVVGDAAPWTVVSPPSLSLFPGTEGTVQLRFQPPRSGAVPAGVVPFGARVVSREDAAFSVVEEGALTVGAFVDVSARLTPRTSETKRAARHEITLENRGNAPVEAEVLATDPDEQLAFGVEPPRLAVAPGEVGRARLRVAARKGFLKGPPRHLPFHVHVIPTGQAPVVLDGAVQQKPGMPRFVLPVLGLAVAATVLAAVVPSIIEAQRSEPATPAGNLAPTTTAPVAAPAEDPTPAAGDGQAAAPGGGEPAPATTASTAPPTTRAAIVVPPPRPDAPQRVAFTSNRTGAEQVFAVDLNGADLRQLTTEGTNRQPAWSPDRQRLAFVSDRTGVNALWLMNRDGSNQVQLTTPGAGRSDTDPRWSPDGTRIAFTSDRNGHRDIWVVRADGSGLVNLTSSADVDTAPSWSRDSERIAWQRTPAAGGRTQVWVMAASAGAAQVQLTKGDADHRAPAWSPTANLIALESNGADGNFEIYLLDADRPNDPLARITTNKVDDLTPAWRADGSTLVVSQQVSGANRDLVTMGAGGAEPKPLAPADGVDADPHL